MTTPRRRPRHPGRIRDGLDAIGAGIEARMPLPEPAGLGEALIQRAREAPSREKDDAMPDETPEGHILLPRKAPIAAVAAVAVTLIGQVYWAGTYTTTVENRITSLVESDARIIARGDERYAMLMNRMESLERDRDRLPKLEERFGRIEEKMTAMIELLRETRQERREGPKRGG